MQSTAYYEIHNRKVETQARTLGVRPGTLISGHKKDVVLTKRLAANPGKIAIYGWQGPSGAPIQPLSTVHGACYADYSHGIRLVSQTALVNGRPMSIYDVLSDPVLSNVLSDEGPLPNVREMLTRMADSAACESPTGRL
jgi:hypothetical protein